MPALFPNSVRIYSSKEDLADTVLADHVNLLQDEVTAVEQTLGLGLLISTWSGTYSTPSSHASLSARLINIEAGLSSLTSGKLNLSGGTLTGALTGTTATFAGAVTGGSFSGPGGSLTGLNASELSSGTIPSDRLTGNYGIGVTGNAATASKWQTARTLSFEGDVTGSASIDGSAAVTVTAATPNSVSKTNGAVTTASTTSAVVRNIRVSTSDPTSNDLSTHLEGDVWLKVI